jgi:hypothetical protein
MSGRLSRIVGVARTWRRVATIDERPASCIQRLDAAGPATDRISVRARRVRHVAVVRYAEPVKLVASLQHVILLAISKGGEIGDR